MTKQHHDENSKLQRVPLGFNAAVLQHQQVCIPLQTSHWAM